MKNGAHGFIILRFGFTPDALIIKYLPAPLVLEIIPILVILKIDLNPIRLVDIQDLIVMIIELVKIGYCPLSHLGIQDIELQKQVIEPVVNHHCVEPDSLCLSLRDGITM